MGSQQLSVGMQLVTNTRADSRKSEPAFRVTHGNTPANFALMVQFCGVKACQVELLCSKAIRLAFARIVPAFALVREVERGFDQCDVRECLRKISYQPLLLVVVLFSQQSTIVG